MKRRIILIALLLLAVLSVLALYPRSRLAICRSWHILKGDLVDVGGYRLRFDCRGKERPVVVLESGLTFGRDSWNLFWPELRTFARVFTYDRAGLGGSDRGPKPRTSLQIVRELHAVLRRARIPGPFVLVGHSFGGLNVRLYASYYPEEVAGIVLINASHEDQYARFAALLSPDEKEKYLRHEGGENREGVDLLASAAEVRAAPPIPVVPAVVLSSFREDQSGNRSMAMVEREIQQTIARIIPKSRHIVAENCGHFIQLDRPEIVVEAIRTVVEEVRKTMQNRSGK